MRSVWRFLKPAAALLVVGVVVVSAVAVMVVAVPVVLVVVGLAVLALVTGLGTHLRHGSRRRRAAPRGSDRAGTVDGQRSPSAAPRWTTGWESELSADAVPLARDRVALVLGEWGVAGEGSEPALLVVTELMSNAVEHGRGPVRLTIEFFGTWVRIEMYDGSPEPPRLQPPDPLRVRGRGIQLVDALSSQWGWTSAPPGKVVWADVPAAWPS